MPKWLEKRAREKFGEHGTNIQLFLVTLMSNLPYMMLACIPLFRVRPEASLRPPPHFLHRPSHLRAAHPHIRLCRDHTNRARNNRTQPRGSWSDCGMGYCAALVRIPGGNFPVNPSRLSAGLVHQHLQIPFWRICLSNRARRRGRYDLLRHFSHAMRKIIALVVALAGFSATASPADRHMAFERNNAVYVANLDGSNEKKIADGIFPAISPDGIRVAFNTVEKDERHDLRASYGGGRRRDWRGDRL
jgi:hypothetical protein